MLRSTSIGLLLLLGLAGCETMFTHYRLPDNQVKGIGALNAAANSCVASGAYSKDEVAEYNFYAAMLLDVSVSNRPVLEDAYRTWMQKFEQEPRESLKAGCTGLKETFGKATENLKKEYQYVVTNVLPARKAEMAEFGKSLSQAGQSFRAASPSLQINSYAPPVSFESSTSPVAQNFLVNTGSGLVQCRTTTKGFVFCN